MTSNTKNSFFSNHIFQDQKSKHTYAFLQIFIGPPHQKVTRSCAIIFYLHLSNMIVNTDLLPLFKVGLYVSEAPPTVFTEICGSKYCSYFPHKPTISQTQCQGNSAEPNVVSIVLLQIFHNFVLIYVKKNARVINIMYPYS